MAKLHESKKIENSKRKSPDVGVVPTSFHVPQIPVFFGATLGVGAVGSTGPSA
jgi:hypothetical protein